VNHTQEIIRHHGVVSTSHAAEKLTHGLQESNKVKEDASLVINSDLLLSIKHLTMKQSPLCELRDLNQKLYTLAEHIVLGNAPMLNADE